MVNTNTIKELIEEMSSCDLFIGKYDAKHGNEYYMYGVSAVMEYLAYRVSGEYGDEFSKMFTKNMLDSENEKWYNNYRKWGIKRWLSM